MHVHIQRKVVIAVLSILFLLSIGTGVYSVLEKWHWIDSLYFTTSTLTTIGYGDLVPTHEISKLFTVIFVFSGVGIFLFSMSIITEYYFHQKFFHIETRIKKVEKVQKKDQK